MSARASHCRCIDMGQMDSASPAIALAFSLQGLHPVVLEATKDQWLVVLFWGCWDRAQGSGVIREPDQKGDRHMGQELKGGAQLPDPDTLSDGCPSLAGNPQGHQRTLKHRPTWSGFSSSRTTWRASRHSLSTDSNRRSLVSSLSAWRETAGQEPQWR